MWDLATQRQGYKEYGDSLIDWFPEEHNFLDMKNRTFTFQVTDDCCMACTYCYQTNKSHHSMSFETAKKVVDMLLDMDNPCPYLDPYKNTSSIVFEFIGGEPFMEIDLITQICDYIEEQMIIKHHPWIFRHRYSICSNGLLYFEPKVQNFIRKYNSSLSFSISIDGNKELHDSCRVDLNGNGTYDRAIKAVKHYQSSYNTMMGSKMTISPDNIIYTKDAVIGLIESGYTVIHLNCVYEEGWTVEHAKIFYQQLKDLADYLIDNDLHKKYYIDIYNFSFFHPKETNDNDNWCGGVNNLMFAVDWKGDFFPCIRYMESSLNNEQEPMIIGSVDTGLYATEEQKARDCLLCSIDRRTQSTDECYYCPIAEGCSWCSAYNYQVYGTPNKRVTYICIMHKARALANAYFWNKAFKKEKDDPQRMKLYIPKQWALDIIDEDEWNMLWSMQY